MNKNIFNKILLVLPLIAISADAATPQSINYQSVVRSNSGTLVANQTVYVKVEILRDDVGVNQVVYSEMHSAKTNVNGSFAIKIGDGTSRSGELQDIDWSLGKFVIRTSTSTDKELTDAAVATSPISSVPYALYSLKSADSFSGRWADLQGKPEMSEYAKIEDVAGYAADSTRKILADYATQDDVMDLHNRSIRSSNYRIDSLKSVLNSSNYYISELQTNLSKIQASAGLSSLANLDTLSTFATKESVTTLSKNTNEAISELTQIVNDNKELSQASDKYIREIQRLYAKKDTLLYFMTKSDMSDYASNDDVQTLAKSVGSLSQTIIDTDTKISNQAATISTLSSTVTENKKEADKKMASMQSELDQVDDKIAASERKIKADELTLSNRIAANEDEISKLSNANSQLSESVDKSVASIDTKIDNLAKSNSAAIDSLAGVTTAIAEASAKDTKSKIDSIAKDVNDKIVTLNSNLIGTIDSNIKDLVSEIGVLDSTTKSHNTLIATNSTNLANASATLKQIATWAQSVNATNDSLATALKAAEAKHKADSLAMAKRIDDLENELKSIKSSNLTESDVNTLIQAALTAAGLNGLNTTVGTLNTTVSGLSTDVTALKNTIGNASSGLVKEVSSLNDRVDALETTTDLDVTELNGKISSLETATSGLSTLNTTVSGLSTDVTALKNTIGNASSGLVKEVSSLNDRVDALESASSTSDITELSGKVATLETTTSSLEGRVDA